MLFAVAEAAGLRAEDEVAAKTIELSEVTCSTSASSSILRIRPLWWAFAAARFSALVMTPSKRGASESQIVVYSGSKPVRSAVRRGCGKRSSGLPTRL